jgi:undecaprenyl-diphosphatase
LEWWHAIVLGLVEGITEYLPISSTGHLIITSSLLGLDGGATKQAVDDFNIVIQGGAILAVLGLYRARVMQMLRGVFGKDPAGLRLFVNLVVAFLPAAVVGFLLHDMIERYLFFPVPVLMALAVGGVYMMALEQWRRGRFGIPLHGNRRGVEDVTIKQAFGIGCLQCIAMWPGTSRSMMTITGGYLAGLAPAAAAEFSFLLGLPTLGAASVYSLLKNLKHAHDTGGPNLFQSLGWGACALGVWFAAVSAALAVKWLVGFLNKRGLSAFGWYRLALCVVMGLLIWRGIVSIAPDAKAETARDTNATAVGSQ